jgi:diketogulonate reductase-like aldo/keto reductase
LDSERTGEVFDACNLRRRTKSESRVYLIGREPVMRMSTSLLALCCQSGPDATWETPISARSRSNGLSDVAARLGATPMQVALAWLLQRSPNILVIPGTSSVEHLRENLQASTLRIPPEVIADLDAIGGNAWNGRHTS